jgi:transcriptional regulator with XRE-family HTH domain
MTQIVRGPKTCFMASADRPSHFVERAAARLRVTRCVLGFTQRALADMCGASEARWSNWERADHLPDIVSMSQLAALFRIPLDWLYRGDIGKLPHELLPEILRRRPDLVLGAAPDAEPSSDWDTIAARSNAG